MTTAYDKDGKPVEATDAKTAAAITNALRAGQLLVKGSDTHYVVNRYGVTTPVLGSDLGAYLAAHPTEKVATGTQATAAIQHAKFGGLGQQAITAAESLARGASVGLYDPAAVGVARAFGGDEAAEEYRQNMAGRKEENPILSTAGEVAGAVIPGLLSGGAAEGVEGAELAARLAQAGEAGAEGLDAAKLASTPVRALAEGGEAAQAAQAAGAGAGAEAAQAGGGLLSGAYNAAKSAVGAAGILPRGIARAGELAGEGIEHLIGSEATSGIGRVAQGAIKSAAQMAVEGGLYSAGGAISDATLNDEELTAEKMLSAVGHGALYGGLIGGGIGGASKAVSEGLGGLAGKFTPELEEQASHQAWKSLGAKGNLAKEAERRAGGTTAVGRTWFEQVLKPEVEQKGIRAAAMSNAEKLEATQAAVDRVGQKIGSLVDEHKAAIKVGEFLKPIDDKIASISGKSTSLTADAAVSKLQQLRSKLLAATGIAEGDAEALATKEIPLTEAMGYRRQLQADTNKFVKSLDVNYPTEELRNVARSWGDMEESHLNEVSAEAGKGQAGDELRGLNKQFQQLKLAEKAIENNVGGKVNRNLSLTSYLTGIAPGMTALLNGHPLGAAAGLLGAVGHQVVRAHGNAYTALLLDKLSSMGSVSEAAMQFNHQIGRAIRTSISDEVPAIAGHGVHTAIDEKNYVKERKKLEALERLTPDAREEQLAAAVSPAAAHSPGLAAQLKQKTIAATDFLKSKAPPQLLPQNTLTPHLEKPAASAEEQAKFLRYTAAVEGGPIAIMGRLAKGQMTLEDAETFKTVFPKAYEDTRAQIAQQCTESKKPIPYQRRLQLATLFDLPTDPTVTADFIKQTQPILSANIQQQSTPNPVNGKPKRGSSTAKLKIASQIQGPFERAMTES
jgi:hypothetical protein